jgi:tetratricopeptide (TPR) repeat protein
MSLQEQYDDAMFDFSQGEFDSAIAKFEGILAKDPAHFDAQLSLGMAHYRKGDFAKAIEEGHKAEKLRPHEQLVHTNLSLFYMKSGDKKTAEHHGLQARIASWRTPVGEAAGQAPSDPELELAKPPPPPPRPVKMPEMPWKKNKPIVSNPAQPTEEKKEQKNTDG